MRKIKQGGVLGRNLKHARKINLLRFAMFAIAICLMAGTYASTSGHTVGGVVAAGTSLAIVGGAAGGEETPEQMLMNKIKGEIKSAVESENKTAVKEISEQLKELVAKAKESKEAEIIKEVAALQGIVKAMKEESRPSATSSKSFADNIMDALKLVSTADLIALKDGSNRRIQLKSATTMGTGNVDAVGTNSIPFTLAQNDPGLTRVQRRNPFILQLCNVATTNKMYVGWAEQRNPDGGAGTTAEAAAKTQADFDIVEASQKVEKITSYIKTSKESLDDFAGLDSEIRTELMELVALKLDSQILLGSGVTPNLNGIITQASTFAGTPFVNAVDYATRWDVLRVAVNQIRRASGGDSNFAANFVPNYIVLNPDDVAALELTKTNSFGQYVIPPFAGDSGRTLAGCTIIENPGMTSGAFLVGDFTKANVRIRENANVSVGYENDDFTKNLVTILCELRAASFIKSNHTNAFVYGASFAAAITSLKDAKS